MTKGIAAPLGDYRSRKEYGTIGYARNDGGSGFLAHLLRKVLPYILTAAIHFDLRSKVPSAVAFGSISSFG